MPLAAAPGLRPSGIATALVLGSVLATGKAHAQPNDLPPLPALTDSTGGLPLFATFQLPDAWEERFWSDPGMAALLRLEPKGLVALVPTQAGFRFCACPACGADESADPLVWSAGEPAILTCRVCKAKLPNETYPAKAPPAPGAPAAVPEEVVEVLPRVLHKYPYHAVEADKQRYPDERMYLLAKRDFEKREHLARAALYAAVRSTRPGDPTANRALARFAGLLILRFAQVYPAYATHVDQPNRPKMLLTASLKPPYRPGYQLAKWSWTASEDVPLNLLIADGLLRKSDIWPECGRLLGEPEPHQAIERFFRSCAGFVASQPHDHSEATLHACRGMLAVASTFGDDRLRRLAVVELERTLRTGFYHDGVWHESSGLAQRRVVRFLEGWIGPLLAGGTDDGRLPGSAQPDVGLAEMLPFVRMARDALSVELDAEAPRTDVETVTWRPTDSGQGPRQPRLLGGAGLCRLVVGEGARALDLEILGQGEHGLAHAHRLAIRASVGGRPVLGDLDAVPPDPRGYHLATASHNAALIDGLNQRESLEQLRQDAPGSDILLHAVEPDFQVVAYHDRYAYTKSCQRYRRTVIAVGGPTAYAIDVFEMQGGLQHDSVWHAAPGSAARWSVSTIGPQRLDTLLPRGIRFLTGAQASEGRWFLQSFGELGDLVAGSVESPIQASLQESGRPGVRLHLLGDLPLQAVTGIEPDPTPSDAPAQDGTGGRGALVLRRHSPQGRDLDSTFVTVIEPVGPTGTTSIRRAGRLDSPPGTVLIAVDTAPEREYVYITSHPGEVHALTLLDGSMLVTDCFAVLVGPGRLVAAGGSFAEHAGRRVVLPPSQGRIVRAAREVAADGSHRGWFESTSNLPQPDSLTHRTLIVRHGDGTSRAWTVTRAVSLSQGGTRIEVREEPGFSLDPRDGHAAYYQFPHLQLRGPHDFHIVRVGRSDAPRDPAARADALPD